MSILNGKILGTSMTITKVAEEIENGITPVALSRKYPAISIQDVYDACVEYIKVNKFVTSRLTDEEGNMSATSTVKPAAKQVPKAKARPKNSKK